MRITQGAFSFLPDLTDGQIAAQVEYCLRNDWAIGVEYTDDPHPRNAYWEMWGNPMFDLKDAAGVMMEVRACRDAHPDSYIRLNAFEFHARLRNGAPVLHGQPPEGRAEIGSHARRGAWPRAALLVNAAI